MSLNDDLSNLFHTFAALMEIKGESAFKAIAFSKVSRILKDLPIDLRTAFEQGTLENIEGLGRIQLPDHFGIHQDRAQHGF